MEDSAEVRGMDPKRECASSLKEDSHAGLVHRKGWSESGILDESRKMQPMQILMC